MAVVGPGTRRFVTDFRYVEQARPRGRRASTVERGPQDLLDALREGWPRRASCASASTTTTSPCARTARLRELRARPDRARARRRAGRGRARGQGARGARAPSARPRRWPTTSTAGCAEQGLVGRTEREVALALEHEMRLLRRRGPELPVDRRGRPSTARCRTPTPRDVPIPADTLVTLDLGRRLRRLLLGLHAHVGDRRAARRPRRDLRARAARPRRPRWPRCAPGPTGREVDAVAREHHRRGGPRRALRPRARPRRRPRGPRGAAAEPDRRPTRSWPGNVVTVEPGVYVPGARRRAHRGPRRGHRGRPRGAHRHLQGAAIVG